jgi:hypothetical protein
MDIFGQMIYPHNTGMDTGLSTLTYILVIQVHFLLIPSVINLLIHHLHWWKQGQVSPWLNFKGPIMDWIIDHQIMV